MKILNTNEVSQVSGGVDGITLAIGGIAIINLIWNLNQNVEIHDVSEALGDTIMLTLYQEVQLQLLPHYYEVGSLSPAEIFNRV